MFLFRSLSIFIFTVIVFAGSAFSQNTDPWSPFPDRERGRDDESKIVKDLLSKQRSEQDKKDYEELLDRGNEALALSDELEKAFEKNANLTVFDKKKLADLEKLVKKIRDELGGKDDEGDDAADDSEQKTPAPSNLKEGFDILRSATAKLVDELKKSSRFSISAVAIQSSNTVIKIIRFLRLKN